MVNKPFFLSKLGNCGLLHWPWPHILPHELRRQKLKTLKNSTRCSRKLEVPRACWRCRLGDLLSWTKNTCDVLTLQFFLVLEKFWWSLIKAKIRQARKCVQSKVLWYIFSWQNWKIFYLGWIRLRPPKLSPLTLNRLRQAAACLGAWSCFFLPKKNYGSNGLPRKMECGQFVGKIKPDTWQHILWKKMRSWMGEGGEPII